MDKAVVVTFDEIEAMSQKLVRDIVERLKAILPLSQVERPVARNEIAELLGVSLPTIDRLVSEGKIPSMQIKTRRLFIPSKVFAALNSVEGSR